MVLSLTPGVGSEVTIRFADVARASVVAGLLGQCGSSAGPAWAGLLGSSCQCTCIMMPAEAVHKAPRSVARNSPYDPQWAMPALSRVGEPGSLAHAHYQSPHGTDYGSSTDSELPLRLVTERRLRRRCVARRRVFH
jgi:hypothetical protein